MDNSTRFAWARLNADTLAWALLAFFAGLFDILDPARDDVTALVLQVLEDPYPLHYVRAGGYVLAGLLLTGSLLLSSVRVEVVARCLLVSAIALNVWRHGVWLGWLDSSTVASTVLLVIVSGAMAMRLSVLLAKGGLIVTRPAVKDDA